MKIKLFCKVTLKPIVFIFTLVFIPSQLIAEDQLLQTLDFKFLNEQVSNSEAKLYEAAQKNLTESKKAHQQITLQRHIDLEKTKNEEISALKEAESHYKNELELNHAQISRPYSIFNLAQTQIKLGAFYFEKTKQTSYLKAALDSLGQIVDEYQDFDHYDQALYLSGQVNHLIGNETQANNDFLKVSRLHKSSIFVFSANFELGINHYLEKDYDSAKRYFIRAVELSDSLAEVSFQLKAQSYYWYTWSAYQNLELALAGKTVEKFFTHREFMVVADYPAMKDDLTAILARIYYETMDSANLSEILQGNSAAPYADALGLQLIQLVLSEGNATKIKHLVPKIASISFGWESYPKILQNVSYYYATQHDLNTQIHYLESLALLLPKNSLWRDLHSNHPKAVKDMEGNAYHAAKVVSAHYYKLGLATDSQKAFVKARNFFKMVYEKSDSDLHSQRWLLFVANCHIYEESYNEAVAVLLNLNQKYQLDIDEQRDVLFLSIVAYGKMILNQTQKLVQNKNQNQNQAPTDHFTALNSNADELNAKFANSTQNASALLLVANLNKDSNRWSDARKYWQLVLAAIKNPASRATAIRGLLFVSVSIDSPQATISLARQLLKSENWHDHPKSLRVEVLSILDAAIKKEKERLVDNGDYSVAATMLVDLAREFPNELSSSVMYYEAAKLYATVHEWQNVEALSKAAKNDIMTPFAKEMSYLHAQSIEHLLKFDEAASDYITFAREYSNDKNAFKAASNARDYYVQTQNYSLAAQAEELRYQLAPTKKIRSEALTRAIRYYVFLEKPETAYRLAQEMIKTAETRDEKLIAQMYEIKTASLTYRFDEVAVKLNILRRHLNAWQDRISPTSRKLLAAELTLMKSEPQWREFDQIKVQTTDPRYLDAIQSKYLKYQNLKSQVRSIAQIGEPRARLRAHSFLNSRSVKFAQEISQVLNDNQMRITPEKRGHLEQLVAELKEDQRNIVIVETDVADIVKDRWLALDDEQINDRVPSNDSEDGKQDIRYEDDLKENPKDILPNYDLPLQYAH